MAKMFYTIEETKVALAKNEEEIKQYAREGRLREFRDGPRLMFKADQVEQLKSELAGGSDHVAAGDTGSGLNLADSKGASGTSIPLADSVTGKGAAASKEDTAFMDIPLSGSVSGVPSPGRLAPGDSRSGSSAGTRAGGLTVFDVDDSQRADPGAQTSIGSGVQDQINLESVSSGSGLLDLTRESSDTSLGADIDQMLPGKGRKAATPASPAATDVGSAIPGSPIDSKSARGGGAQFVEADDPTAPAFGGLALAGVVVLLFGAFVLVSGLLGHIPQMVKSISQPGTGLMVLGGAVVGVAIFGAVGWFLGRSAR